MKRALMAGPALALAFGAWAGPASDTLSLRLETSHLDRGYASWREQGLSWRRGWQDGRGLELGVTATERFGLEDQRLSVDVQQPLSLSVGLALEAAWSPTHRVLAQGTAGARLSWKFAPQWVGYAGARTSRFNETHVHQGTLAVEHYVGAFSLAASWMPTQALGASTASGSLRGDWYYADRSAVGLLLAGGQEATRVGPGTLVLADVRSVALVGRHALSAQRTLRWGLERTRQGDFHTRTGASVALQHAF